MLRMRKSAFVESGVRSAQSVATCGVAAGGVRAWLLRALAGGSLAIGMLVCGPVVAAPQETSAFVQIFETRWTTIERRTTDIFMAGYDGIWLPGPSLCADPNSAGYDPFDRFDLGRPGRETAFGTFDRYVAMVRELQRAGVLVFSDSIMNHNSGRTSNQAFMNDGGWPGFITDFPGDFWGDFHDAGLQSEDPNAPNYDLFQGDLVGLIDIDQASPYFVIRHPVEEGNPQNIPPGNVRNRPDPANRAFYPDQGLTPSVFVNPSNNQTWTVHPFNLEDPMAGDPVVENTAGLLMRWTQWMIEVVGVDGFRLDAAKHIPQWFWNDYWDVAVHNRRLTPAGTRTTAYSFAEAFGDPGFVLTFTRRDSFANRDALDLNGAGALRDIRAAGGFGSWANVLGAMLDVSDDGFQNGSRGVTHVYSHDNGSTGTGSSPPPVPGPELAALPQHCFIMFHPSPTIVYHNTREFVDLYSSRGFWPREGNPTALGADNEYLTKLVQLRRGYARGEFHVLNGTDPVNQSLADVLVFERRTPTGTGPVGNVLVAVNDRQDSGGQFRSVQTSFAPGTRLHELTGNAADPIVDPTGVIPEVLVVDANRRVLIAVPNNRSATGVLHHRGYVVYGPAAPSGELAILDAAGSVVTDVLAADGPTTPSYSRRLHDIPIVTENTFSIQLRTFKTDPLDPDWDDNAIFRINQGYRDDNGNGVVDIGENAGVASGYEQFITVREPLTLNPSADEGLYRQVIDSTTLDEGVHYVSVLAFRRRTDGGAPILTDFRVPVYVDLLPPQVELVGVDGPIGQLAPTFTVAALDRATDNVHIMLNLPAHVDPLSAVSPSNVASRRDRFEWTRNFGTLSNGEYRLSVVAFEPSGRSTVIDTTVTIEVGTGDVNGDGVVTIEDLHLASQVLAVGGYNAAADMNADGQLTTLDLRLLEALIRQTERSEMVGDQR